MGSVVGEVTGANKRAARAAQGAATEQAGIAKNQYNFQSALSNEIEKAMNDPQALARLESGFQAQERQLARQEELMNAINPALKEAALQAAGLLRGEDAQALAPLRRQRERQRQTLLNSLRSQLGPGAETSSAGLNALNRFDAETDSILGGAQQQTLSGLLGTSLSARPNMAGEIGAFTDQANSRFNRILTGNQARSAIMNPGYGALQGAAGAGQVYNSIRAGQNQRLGGEVYGYLMNNFKTALSFANPMAGLSSMFTSGSSGGGGSSSASYTPAGESPASAFGNNYDLPTI